MKIFHFIVLSCFFLINNTRLVNGCDINNLTTLKKSRCLLIADQSENRVLIVDVKNSNIVWEWSADSSNVLKSHLGWFKAVSEVKWVYDGRYILLTASLGAVALIRIKDKKAVFYTNVGGNTHSAEILPDGNIVSASSRGNYLTLIHMDTTVYPGDVLKRDIYLPQSHNVVWDKRRQLLWSAADGYLYAFKYNFNCLKPDLMPVDSISIPDKTTPHDLFPVSGEDQLWLTTVKSIYKVDLKKDKIEEVKGEITSDIKSVSSGLKDERHPTIVIFPKKKWWTDTVLDIEGKVVFTKPGLKIYKARWLLPNSFSYSDDMQLRSCDAL